MMPNRVIETEKIILYQAQLGDFANLNHLIVCKKTNKALIIDPFYADYWLNFCSQSGWELTTVWLTHTHWDHSKAVPDLVDKEIWVHEDESLRGWDGPSNNHWSNPAWTVIDLSFGELAFKGYSTPGHSPGHMAFSGEGIVVTGDCLFLGRCGRTDLFGSDRESQRKSLLFMRKELELLPQDWLVFPGHLYELSTGYSPSFITVAQLLSQNEALAAIDDDILWESLDFLSFDDDLAKKAQLQKRES